MPITINGKQYKDDSTVAKRVAAQNAAKATTPTTPKTVTAPVVKTATATTGAASAAINAGKTAIASPLTPKPAGVTATPATPNIPAGTTIAGNVTGPVPITTPNKQPVGNIGPVAQDKYKDLVNAAISSGADQARIEEALTSYNNGALGDQGLRDYLASQTKGTTNLADTEAAIKAKEEESVKSAQEKYDSAIALTDKANGTTTGQPYDINADTEAANKAQSDFDAAIEENKKLALNGEKVTIDAANLRYSTEMNSLEALKQMQIDLTNQRNALTESATAIQKKEVQDAYDANQAAMAVQQQKVQEAYKGAQNQQELANKRAEIKAETAMGLIYGYGSVAANKNIEDTVVQGQAALQSINSEAITADTELQNKVIELNNSYSTDLQKIDQWKAETMNQNYSDLQGYIQEIQSKEDMANVEKYEAIANAVDSYNNKIAEMNMTSAQTKYDLSLALIDKANEYKVANQKAAEEKTVNEKQTNLEDLDLIMKTYSTNDYADLPEDVKTRLTDLTAKLNLPESFASEAMKMYKEANTKETTPDFKYYEDESGNVTAVSYNPQTQQFETYDVGAVGKGEKHKYTTKFNEATGKMEPFDETTGQFMTATSGGGSGAKGGPQDALSLPDGFPAGQCGRMVNDYTGLGVGDSYDSKLEKMKPYLTDSPQPGDVFLMPYSWTGHIGFVASVSGNTVTVKDSNWSLDEKVQTHTIPISQIEYFARVGGGATDNTDSTTDSGVQQYVDLAKEVGVDEAEKRLKEEITDKDMQASYLKNFRSGIGAPQMNPLEVPDWMKNLPSTSGELFSQNYQDLSIQGREHIDLVASDLDSVKTDLDEKGISTDDSIKMKAYIKSLFQANDIFPNPKEVEYVYNLLKQ